MSREAKAVHPDRRTGDRTITVVVDDDEGRREIQVTVLAAPWMEVKLTLRGGREMERAEAEGATATCFVRSLIRFETYEVNLGGAVEEARRWEG